MSLRDIARMGALTNLIMSEVLREDFSEYRKPKSRSKKKPATNRDKVKAARKQRRKQKK